MNVSVEKLQELAPELKQKVSSVVEFTNRGSYLIELDPKLPASQYKFLADNISAAFKTLGLNCIVIPGGLIADIYKLKGGESNDSRASIE